MFDDTFYDLMTNTDLGFGGSLANDPSQDYGTENGEIPSNIRIRNGKEKTGNMSVANDNDVSKMDGLTVDMKSKVEDWDVLHKDCGKISGQCGKMNYTSEVDGLTATTCVTEDGLQPPVDGSSLLCGKRSKLPSSTMEDNRTDNSGLTSGRMIGNNGSYFTAEEDRRNHDSCLKELGNLDGKDIIHDIEHFDNIEVADEVMPDDKIIKNDRKEMLIVTSNCVDDKKKNNAQTWFSFWPFNCRSSATSSSSYCQNNVFSNRILSNKGGAGINPETQRKKSEKCPMSNEIEGKLQSNSNQYLIGSKSSINPENDYFNRLKTESHSSYDDLKIDRNQAIPKRICENTEKSPSCGLLTQDPVIETLEDALNCFELKNSLRIIENKLEKVRKRQWSKGQYECDLKQLDKEIQKLSFRYHPDKVRNRGCSDKEMAVAQKLQTALNTTRTVLKVLGEAFLEDIDTDHRYGFYTNLSITSLGNEEDIKKRIHDVVSKISYLSEIKQKNIIAEIRNFLKESRNCIKWYFEDKAEDFENCRVLAMLHLKKCIKGFEKLIAEFGSVEEDCISEKKNNITRDLEQMADKSFTLLNSLKHLKSFLKAIPEGRCRFYQSLGKIDDYFVLPFVCYMNVLVMCNAMFKNRDLNWRRYWPSFTQEYFDCPDTIFLNYSYYLASVYSGCTLYKDIIDKKLSEKSEDREEIRKVFLQQLQVVSKKLEDTFQPKHYDVENTRANLFMDEYLKCMTMLAELKRKEEKLAHRIDQIVNRTQEIEEKYAKAMEGSEEDTNRLKERLERCRLLREQGSATLGK